MRALILAALLLCAASSSYAQEPEWYQASLKAQGQGHARGAGKLAGVPTVGLVTPLLTKLADIQASCPGTVVISAVRHTRIAGSRRMSLHASGQAVDVRGPYPCIYAQIQDWPGGYSTDAKRVRHIHISIGGHEDGLRFVHRARKVRIARAS